ncbi:superoxide dismutase family protein [Flavobacterium amniphilum]|uniref:superoxide dismutase family protein n=1 Tax=Flavobacterium amniphilum TaxID=1834035 RepID=UPI00202A05A9|nr:superoxide dismutase family protein [Flavobacterium amniphilum]MCL9805409.1 superoxide dismutase family protein [Flavobacterium amniphilum]
MKKVIILGLSVFALVMACKTASSGKNELILMLQPKSDTQVSGSASFTEKNGVVTFTANIKGLTPGEHAIHIHEKSDCSAPDASSAGGHWNPTFKKHGKWGSAEYHKGDIGNFTADAQGDGTITFSTDEWCISCEDETKNIIGKSIIVHKGTDDFTTQPTGNAGGRVACTAIIK